MTQARSLERQQRCFLIGAVSSPSDQCQRVCQQAREWGKCARVSQQQAKMTVCIHVWKKRTYYSLDHETYTHASIHTPPWPLKQLLLYYSQQHTHACAHAHTHTQMHAIMHTHRVTHTHTHSHTHTHTHTQHSHTTHTHNTVTHSTVTHTNTTLHIKSIPTSLFQTPCTVWTNQTSPTFSQPCSG